MKKLILLAGLFCSCFCFAQQKEGELNALVAKGLQYEAENIIDSAYACYQEAIELYPDCCEAYYNLGRIQSIRGTEKKNKALIKEGKKNYRKSVKLCPDYENISYAEYYVVIGELRAGYAEEQKSDKLYDYYINESADSYATAVLLKPDFGKAYNNWGALLIQAGKRKKQLKEFKPMIESHLSKANSYGDIWSAYNFARLYSLLKQNNIAIMYLRKLLHENQQSDSSEILTKNRIEMEEDFEYIAKDNDFEKLLNEYFPDSVNY